MYETYKMNTEDTTCGDAFKTKIEINNNTKISMTDTPEYIFPPRLLTGLDWSRHINGFSPPISIASPGEGLVMRPLRIEDNEKGFTDLLGQLTVAYTVTNEQFERQFATMAACKDHYHIVVIEDVNDKRIVATGTLFIEKKFIRNLSQRGRIEDIVVDSKCRGKQLGKLMLETLCLLAESLGCYKMTLECKDHLVPFYELFKLRREEGNSNYMQRRFTEEKA